MVLYTLQGLSTRVCKIKSLFQVPKIKQKKAITAYFFHAVGRCNMYGKVLFTIISSIADALEILGKNY